MGHYCAGDNHNKEPCHALPGFYCPVGWVPPPFDDPKGGKPCPGGSYCPGERRLSMRDARCKA
eukprot:451737-Rhodomonas_salina.1